MKELSKSYTFKFCPFCRYYLRRKQVDGYKRLVCRKCGWIYYGNPLPVVACVTIDNEGKILIVKRNLSPGINKWALPGGFIESNETPEIACLRELEEETGLRGEIKRLIGVYIQKTREYGSLLVIGYEVNIVDWVQNPDPGAISSAYQESSSRRPIRYSRRIRGLAAKST